MFEDIVDTVREPLIVLDPDLRVLEANRSFYKSFRVTPEETIGKLIYDLGNRQWDIPGLRTLLEDILPENNKFDDYEVEHVFSDVGHKIMLLNARRIIHEEKGPQLILLAIEDITERRRTEDELKEYEERFRRLFETSKDGLLLIDKQNGRIVNANPAIMKMLGYFNAEIIGKSLKDVGLLKEINDFNKIVAELVRTGFVNYENVFAETRQGQLIDVDVHLVDRSKFIQCNVRDITERRKAEELTERSLREKTVLLKEIHHRVKNNLQVIISLLNLQAKGISDKAVRSQFEESRNRVFSMSLIHDKLYGSTDLSHVDFKEYLKSLAGNIGETYKKANVIITVDMGAVALDVNAGIPCGLIVNELVSNSLKYAFPEGRKGTIRIGISINSEGANVLFVEDNGIGFPADIDFRNTSSLGLQLVNGLTGQIDGKIELSGEGGSSFRITFPGRSNNGGEPKGLAKLAEHLAESK